MVQKYKFILAVPMMKISWEVHGFEVKVHTSSSSDENMGGSWFRSKSSS